MANPSFRVVPKIDNNRIAIFVVLASTGHTRQVAYLEVPNDCQMNDNVELANEICQAYRKRMRKSL